ncbi:MAG: hypothetical protein Q3982_08000 [Phoenicibacter congonensis]|uniref:Uncharacterized protein n=1 Tax=Phoenicibacter congonensis TaxID=1944646 RepID=A0AA43RIU2_9ACTN|nr:hypothetical protein [Phoenicibacter congonensis]
MSEAKRQANAAYQKRQDALTIRPSKEEGARIRAAAAAAGLSVQRYILDILRQHLPEGPENVEKRE